jgi:polar amino acid transport system substrate-binding protein
LIHPEEFMKKLFAVLLFACAFCGAAGSFAADSELAKKSSINSILARGELRVGFDSGYMPFEMTDKNGAYIGFDMDLGRELAKAMGVKFVPVNTDFDGMIPALLTGKIDVILSAMTITPERNLKIGFSDPYIVVGQSILLNKKHEGKITSWEQLNDPKYSIVSRLGTTGAEAAKRYLPKAGLKTFEKEADGALEVANDRADAWVYDMPFNVVFYAEQGKGKVIHLDQPFTFEPVGIGILQGDPDFLNFLNNFLRQLKADGRYDRLYDKWIKSTDWFALTQN